MARDSAKMAPSTGRESMRGVFITLEGVEGCGKTTQIEALERFLALRGHEVVRTREPGGTPISEAIRAIVLDPRHASMSPTAELLLYEAARAQHVAELIRPALVAGKMVVCDRFADSTTAYQGAGRGILPADVQPLHTLATSGLMPDLTLVLDLPAEEGLRRAARARGKDRMEREPLDFHRRVREAFLDLARREPGRIKVVDGTRSRDSVEHDIRHHVEDLLAKAGY